MDHLMMHFWTMRQTDSKPVPVAHLHPAEKRSHLSCCEFCGQVVVSYSSTGSLCNIADHVAECSKDVRRRLSDRRSDVSTRLIVSDEGVVNICDNLKPVQKDWQNGVGPDFDLLAFTLSVRYLGFPLSLLERS